MIIQNLSFKNNNINLKSFCPIKVKRQLKLQIYNKWNPSSFYKQPDQGLPVSLYHKHDNLPAEGKLRIDKDEGCDPQSRLCPTPTYIYESKCISCGGSGILNCNQSSKRGGRHKVSITCTVCSGIGYTRFTTSRFIPDVETIDGKLFTLARNTVQNGKDTKKSQLEIVDSKLDEKKKLDQTVSNGVPKENKHDENRRQQSQRMKSAKGYMRSKSFIDQQ